MPEPRAVRGRDFLTPVSLQFDRVDARQADYRAQRRERAARTADAYPAPPRRRVRTSAGYAVEPRNGIPFKPYIYRGTGRDQLEDTSDQDT